MHIYTYILYLSFKVYCYNPISHLQGFLLLFYLPAFFVYIISLALLSLVIFPISPIKYFVHHYSFPIALALSYPGIGPFTFLFYLFFFLFVLFIFVSFPRYCIIHTHILRLVGSCSNE